jgi:hypothetical protein
MDLRHIHCAMHSDWLCPSLQFLTLMSEVGISNIGGSWSRLRLSLNFNVWHLHACQGHHVLPLCNYLHLHMVSRPLFENSLHCRIWERTNPCLAGESIVLTKSFHPVPYLSNHKCGMYWVHMLVSLP